MKVIEEKTIYAMHKLYCKDNHGDDDLCDSCHEIYNYSIKRIEACHFQPDKPACSHCPVHCYKADMREKVRDIMRYAGPRMIYRHPFFAVMHILTVIRSKRIVARYYSQRKRKLTQGV